jgi:glycoside/pentoside/hexuronide:cation symporter, GPH family
MANRLSRRQMLGYASGSIAPGVFSTLPGLLLLYFMTNTLGIGAGLAGVIVLGPKLWDVVINPFVGMRSDLTRSRYGARVPYIAVGSVVLAVTLAVLFAVPHLSELWTCVWVLIAYTLCNTGYALFETPYVAVPAEITDDYDERTVLNGWRMVILTLGILISGGLAPGIVSLGGNGRAGYAVMGVVIGLIVAACGLYSAKQIAAIPVVRHRATTASLRDQVRLLRSNRPFAVLLGAYFGQTLAIGAQLAAVPYFATYTLHNKSAVTIVFLALVGPALVVMPMWVRRSAGQRKKRAMIESSVVYAAGSLVLVFTPELPHVAVYLVAAVLGIGFAGMQMVPYAMLPDTIDAGANGASIDRVGDGQAGGLSGLWIGGETLGFALGAAILSGVLALARFHSTVDAHRVAQSAGALSAVRYGFALLPPLLLLATLPLLRLYRVDGSGLTRPADDDLAIVSNVSGGSP